MVVTVEQAVAAPFTTSRLADAGARVIKIERPPEGDFARYYDHVVHGESAYFVWLNRGKESVMLDIKDPEDHSLLRNIIAKADVYVQNLAPGAAERAGIGSVELRRENPRLITCDITGYRGEGEFARMKAYDNLLQGETGVISVTGTSEYPAKVGISICDISAGIYAYSSVLEAIIEREKTGEGQAIKISLFDCMADWMSVPLLHQMYTGKPPKRTGMHHASIAPYGPYQTKDDKLLMIAIQNEREWVTFCNEVLKRPEIAGAEKFKSNSDRVANREELNEYINGIFSQFSQDEMIDQLIASSIAFARINSVEDFSNHPELRLTETDTPTGPVKLVSRPARNPDKDEPGFGKVPSPGEHTDAVRKEFARE